MGRVVKGAKVAKNAYQLRAPAAAVQAARVGVSSFDFDDEEPQEIDAGRETAPPDLDAARAEADKIIEQAQIDAESLITEGRDRALALVDEAQARAGAIEEHAKSAGSEQGRADGLAAVQAEMDEMLQTMRGLVEMARVERHKIIDGAEADIVRLAVTICERILNAHLALEPAAVLEMVRAAIGKLVSRETVTVRVNPADIGLMRDHREEIMSMNDISNMRLVEDRRVDRGGVVIDTDAGTIDAKLSTQLREVRRLLAVEEPLAVPPSEPLLNAPAQAS